MNLKSLPQNERPRERMVRYGSDGLSAVELIAILLGHGTQSRSVLELAADLLVQFRTLQALAEASLQELQEIKGIGQAKAIQLKAAFALWGRLEGKERAPCLNTPESVYELVRSDLASQKIEMLMVILRDVRRRCIHREIIAKGTLTELLMHPREIFHTAIRHRAHSLIIAHNHPSGDPTPSKKDLEMTQILTTAATIVGIEIADHLVIGNGGYFSFAAKGLISRPYY